MPADIEACVSAMEGKSDNPYAMCNWMKKEGKGYFANSEGEQKDKDIQDGIAEFCATKDKKFVEKQVYDAPGVEIFKAGKWNGKKYTVNDLNEMVRAHNEIGHLLKPYLKLGHDNNQALLQEDGYPSAGWVDNLRVQGDTLLADLKSIPRRIKELIDAKAYGRFSSEIYQDITAEGKQYHFALKALALLGGDTPAVKTLDDFVALYEGQEVALAYALKNAVTVVADKEEIEDMADEKVVAEFTEKVDSLTAKLAEVESAKVALELKFKEQEAEVSRKAAEAHWNDVLDKAVRDGRVLPVQVNAYKALALDGIVVPDGEGVRTLVFTEGENEKHFTWKNVNEVLEGLIDSMPKLIKFEDAPAAPAAPAPVVEPESPTAVEDKLADAVETFMATNKGASYKDAIRAVYKK